MGMFWTTEPLTESMARRRQHDRSGFSLWLVIVGVTGGLVLAGLWS